MYKMTTNWEEKLYIGITLELKYIKQMVEISMSGYVYTTLNEFQHPKLLRPKDSPYIWTAPTYNASNQLTFSPDIKSIE